MSHPASLLSEESLIKATEGRLHYSTQYLGHQTAWDSTSLGDFKTCPRKYFYSHVLALRSRREALPLKFGIHYHSGLEYYDHAKFAGKSHDDSIAEAIQRVSVDMGHYKDVTDPETGKTERVFLSPWVSDDTKRNMFTCLRAIVWYLDNYKDDVVQTVMLSNGSPAVELSFRMQLPQLETLDKTPYRLCGHLDRVIEYAETVYVMDRKTTTTAITQDYYERYSPDNQMSLYTMAAKVVFQVPAKGVIIDAVQTAVGFSRYHRGFVHRTPSQTDEWLLDLEDWLKLAERYSERRYWPMNDKSCGMYGGCTYQNICNKDPAVRHSFLSDNFERRPWDPLVPRGKTIEAEA